MKSHTLVQNILKIAIIFILALACMNMSVLATDPTEPNTEPTEPVEVTPYINFEIKTTKLEDNSKQIQVECWGKDFTNLVGLDFVFQYDNNKLTPSYLDETGKVNKVIDGLDTIQYVNRSEIVTDEKSFLDNSKEILSNSFKLNSELVNGEEKPILKTYVLRYEESRFDGEDEIAKTIMVSISKNDLITQVSDDGTNPKGVKIGTFSFRLADGQSVSEEDFNLIRTLVMCDDGKTTDPDGEEDISLYERDITSNDPLLINVEDIAKFVLGDEPTGSISGTIQTNVKKSKNTASIKLYDKKIIGELAWKNKGNKYTALKTDLPEPTIEYNTKDGDNGVFMITEIPFGEYVMLVEKANFLDTIITDIDVKDTDVIDLDKKIGDVILYPGDLNGDGQITLTDKTKCFDVGYKTKNKEWDLNDDGKLTLADKTVFDSAYKVKKAKPVISLKAD